MIDLLARIFEILWVPQQLVADVLGISLLIWVVIGPTYNWINAWADRQEKSWWGFIQHQHIGNPASWIQHTFEAACIMAAGDNIVLFVSSPSIGAAHWCIGGFAFYLQREVRGWREHSRKLREGGKRQQDMWSIRHGWKLDALMDVLGATAIMVIVWIGVL